MITGLILFASIFILYGIVTVMIEGFAHVWFYIEQKRDEKKDKKNENERYEKYLSMFKYNP